MLVNLNGLALIWGKKRLNIIYMYIHDSFSKWLEVAVVSSCSSQQTIIFLRHVLSTHGLPEMLISYNGTAFTPAEFKTFVAHNGVRHLTSAPYHPVTNGLVERAIQMFKEAFQKTSGERYSTTRRLYRVTATVLIFIQLLKR